MIGINEPFVLVDGTAMTVPRYAIWLEGFGWELENHGVDPDVEVLISPQDWAEGRDVQLETAVRLHLRLLVAIYDDRAYGAEVHHFEPMGHDVSRVRFPDADLAAIARAAGAEAITVRRTQDLEPVSQWVTETDPGPLVLDAKVNPAICAEWLAEAFRTG